MEKLEAYYKNYGMSVYSQAVQKVDNVNQESKDDITMRKVFGFWISVACYIPIIFLAIWLGREKEILGLMAAGLFLFFGFILCMAIYSAVGIPNKDNANSKNISPPTKIKKNKTKDKIDTGTAILAATMADTDRFDDFDDGDPC